LSKSRKSSRITNTCKDARHSYSNVIQGLRQCRHIQSRTFVSFISSFGFGNRPRWSWTIKTIEAVHMHYTFSNPVSAVLFCRKTWQLFRIIASTTVHSYSFILSNFLHDENDNGSVQNLSPITQTLYLCSLLTEYEYKILFSSSPRMSTIQDSKTGSVRRSPPLFLQNSIIVNLHHIFSLHLESARFRTSLSVWSVRVFIQVNFRFNRKMRWQ